MAINTTVIVGRVGQDPEMQYFETGKVKTRFSIAVNRWSKQGEKTDWFNVECWDKQAEVAGEYVKKGRQVAIDGKLEVSQWTDTSTGELRERYYINAHSIKLLGGRNDA